MSTLTKTCERLFKLVDKDANGFLDQDEFKKLHQVLVPDPKIRGPNHKKSFQKAGAVSGVDGKLRMDMAKFSTWCTSLLEHHPEDARNNIVHRVIATQDASADYTTKAGVLPAARRAKADELFAIHDIDCGGALSFQEFMSFIVVYDPACDLDGAKKTFLSCANDDVMDTFEFYEWVVRTFGNLDDGEYQKGMSELLAAAKAVSAGQLEGLTDAQQVRLLQLKLQVAEETLKDTQSNEHTLQQEHDAELEQLHSKISKLEEDANELIQHRAAVKRLEAQLADDKVARDALKERVAVLEKERALVMEMLQPGNCSASPFKELDQDWQPLVELVMRVPELETKNTELLQQVTVLQQLMDDMRKSPASETMK